MKEILGFHLNGCPYCANAFRAIDELVAENPAYADIHINWVEDQDAHERHSGSRGRRRPEGDDHRSRQ